MEKDLHKKYQQLGIDFPKSIDNIIPGKDYAIMHWRLNRWTENNTYCGKFRSVHIFVNIDTKELTTMSDTILFSKIKNETIAFTAPDQE